MNLLFRQLLPYWILGFYVGSIFAIGYIHIIWFASLYALAYFFLASKWKYILEVLFKDIFLIILITLVGFSCIWSVNFSITFATFRSLIIKHVLAGVIATSYKPEKIVKFIAIFFSFTSFLSLVYIIFIPRIGIATLRGTSDIVWRGIFPHQSILAATASIGIISLFNAFLIRNRASHNNKFKFLTSFFTLICLFLLLFCGAKTAIVALTASFVIPIFGSLNLIKGSKERTFVRIFLTYLVLFGVPLVYVFRELIIVNLLGKSLTLTGRDFTWNFMLQKLLEQPILGFGHTAFWHHKPFSQEFAAIVGRHIPEYYNSHSSYLDCLVGLGYLGMSLLLVFLVLLIWRNLVLYFRFRSLVACWNLQIIIFIAIASFSDSFIGFLVPRGFGWLILNIITLTSALQYESFNKASTTPQRNFYLYCRE